MLREKTGIGPGLLFMVLYVSLFSFGVSQSARVASEHAGNNGYWAFVLAFILSIPVIAVLVWWGRNNPDQSVIQFLPKVFGGVLGKALGLALITGLLVLTVWTLRFLAEEVGLYFLNRTPIAVSAALFLLIALYVAHSGIEAISRLAAFIFPVTFLLSFLAIVFSFQDFRGDNIRPLFFSEGMNIPYGAIHLFYPFAVLLTVMVINPYLTDRQRNFRAIFAAAGLASLLIFLLIISGIGNYGAKGILRYSFPALEQTRKANLPLILQTFGLFFGATWLSQILVTLGLFYYALAEGVSQWLNVWNYKSLTVLMFPLVYALGMLPTGIIDLRAVFPLLRLASFSLIAGLVLLLALTTAMRKGR